MNTTDILYNIKRRLPHSTQNLVRLVGWNGALTLLKNNASHKEVYFPLKFSTQSNVYEGLTPDQAQALYTDFKGLYVRLPRLTTMLRSERYTLIANDYVEREFTVNMLSEKYRLSVPVINKLIRRFNLKELKNIA